MSTCVMLDSETLGTGPDAVILTIGAVKFDPYNLQEPHTPLYFRIDVDEQTALGRTIDQSTLDWWSKQDPAIFEEAMADEDRIPLAQVIAQINKYVVGVDKIWAQGILFDIGMLENLYRQMKCPCPWNFWQIRDSRTIMDLGDDSAKTGNKSAHNALADAYSQAVAVQNIFKQLGVKQK